MAEDTPGPPPVPGQVLLEESYLCGICGHDLVTAEHERIVALACTHPPSHVFHGNCIDQWRETSVAELGLTCPTCSVNPQQAIARRILAGKVKKRIKARRESCWRQFWIEWHRQRSLVTMVMLAVIMLVVVVQILEDWIRTWSSTGARTEL